MNPSTSLLNSKVLSFILQLGYIFGCAPKDIVNFRQISHFKTPNSFRRIFCTYFYSVLSFLLINFIEIEFIITSYPLISELQTSKLILSHAINYAYYISDFCRRLFFLLKYQALINLFKNINESSKSTNKDKLQHFPNIIMSDRKYFYYLLMANFLASMLRSVRSIVSVYFRTTTGRDVTSIIFNGTSMLKPYVIGSTVYSDYCAMASRLFSRGLIFIFGDIFLEKYMGILYEFQNNVESYNYVRSNNLESGPFVVVEPEEQITVNLRSAGNQIRPLSAESIGRMSNCETSASSPAHIDWKAFSKDLQNVQEYFLLYTSIAGFLVFIDSVDSIVFILFFLHRLNNEFQTIKATWLFFAVAGLFEHAINLYMIGLIGHRIKSAVLKGQQAIRRTLFDLTVGEDGNEKGFLDKEIIKIMADTILKWKCQLTAANLFKVNLGLLPAMAGTLMTFVMFIFQLKISEETSGLNPPLNITH